LNPRICSFLSLSKVTPSWADLAIRDSVGAGWSALQIAGIGDLTSAASFSLLATFC
jgi:hypothetical protein